MRRAAVVLAVLGSLLLAGSAYAGPPCADWSFTSPGTTTYGALTIPQSGGTTSYHGYYFIGSSLHLASPLPVVVLLHGKGGSACTLWWAGRLLASQGFAAIVIKYGAAGTPAAAAGRAALAGRSVVAWLATQTTLRYVDPNNISLVGSGVGAIGAEQVQEDPALTQVRAVAGIANLAAYATGDPGGAGGCGGPPGAALTPRVPALGVTSPEPCASSADATNKDAGYAAWRAAGVPVEQVVLAHATRARFGGNGQHTTARRRQLKHTAYYLQAWLDRWQHGDMTEEATLVSQAPTVINRLFDNGSDTRFASSAFLPSKECVNLRACP